MFQKCWNIFIYFKIHFADMVFVVQEKSLKFSSFSLQQFSEKFLAGDLTPYRKSQKAPEEVWHVFRKNTVFMMELYIPVFSFDQVKPIVQHKTEIPSLSCLSFSLS